MKDNFDTPILFLIFNRPETTQKVFDTIRQVKPRQLFVAADGPRVGREGEKEKCENTRNIIKQVDWDCEIKTLFRNENLGCGKAISEAITWFFENVELGIILEDDCLPTDSFFPFCQKMLNKYKKSNQIGMITGTNYLFGYDNFEYSYYFSKHCYVWGWATWKRSWNLYNFSIKDFPDKTFLREYFHDSLSSNYYIGQFNDYKYSKIDTWDIQWTATLITNKLFTIIPLKNQISNIGYLGTHTSKNISPFINMPTSIINIQEMKYPKKIFYNDNLDLISIKTIVSKITKRSFIKSFLIKILKRKNIEFIKKFLSLNLNINL